MLSDKSNIVQRAGKGSPLTHIEMDTNLNELRNVIDDVSNILSDSNGVLQNAIDARDDASGYAIDALTLKTEVQSLTIEAQQAVIDAGSQVQVFEDELADPADPSNGAGKVWYQNPLAGAIARATRGKLIETFSALDAGLSAGSSDTLRAAMVNVDYLEPMMYGAYRRINGINATTSISDEANFAGQGLGTSAPIGSVKHHYTDGTMVQWDNVGDGTMLVLKNAFNPTRRPDKPSDYVGTGIFVAFAEHDYAAGFSKTMAYISNKAEIVWTGVKGIATLWQNKAEDGVWAFQFKTTNAHTNVLRFLNGAASFLGIGHDVGFTRAFIKSDPSQTNGLYLEAGASDLTLGTLDATKAIRVLRPIRSTTGNLILGTVAVDTAVEVQVPFKPRNYTTVGSLPSATTFAGCLLTFNGIPIYANGGVWKYVRDDATVV